MLNGILFAVFFTFYYVFSLHVLTKIEFLWENPAILQALFSFTIAGTLVVASFFGKKLMKMSIIFASSLITCAAAISLLFSFNSLLVLFEVFLVGVFFSICQLAFFVHFWSTTVTVERGRIGGIIGFATLPFYFIMSDLVANGLDFSGTTILATVLLLTPLVVMLAKPKFSMSQVKQNGMYYERRAFILYFVPWIIFSLVNATLSRNITINTESYLSPSSYGMVIILQTVMGLAGALLGGFMADIFGRRAILAGSVALYGTGMALSGVFYNPTSAYLAYSAEGFSWGVFLTLYLFVIWGDLSSRENHAKIYALGLTAFYIAASLGPFSALISFDPIQSALIGCVALFIAYAFVSYAPELQPSDFREKMMLKMHIKAVKKAAEELNHG